MLDVIGRWQQGLRTASRSSGSWFGSAGIGPGPLETRLQEQQVEHQGLVGPRRLATVVQHPHQQAPLAAASAEWVLVPSQFHQC